MWRFRASKTCIWLDTAGSTFEVDGTTGSDDFLSIAGGTDPESGTVTGLMNSHGGGIGGAGSFPLVPITFSGMDPGTVRVHEPGQAAGGTDTLTFKGTSADDRFDIFQNVRQISDRVGGVSLGTVEYNNFSSITIEGLSGNDTTSSTRL